MNYAAFRSWTIFKRFGIVTMSSCLLKLLKFMQSGLSYIKTCTLPNSLNSSSVDNLSPALN